MHDMLVALRHRDRAVRLVNEQKEDVITLKRFEEFVEASESCRTSSIDEFQAFIADPEQSVKFQSRIQRYGIYMTPSGMIRSQCEYQDSETSCFIEYIHHDSISLDQ